MEEKKIILVTGPPGNGRDDYLKEALKNFNSNVKVGYHHIFEYMQKTAPHHNVPNLTRENVFDISKSTLERIRDRAFTDVAADIKKSGNQIEIVSTPAVFRVTPWGDYFTGKVNGITIDNMTLLDPTKIVVFVDDLLRVREQLSEDPLWAPKDLRLKDLAEWRRSAIGIVQEYCDQISSMAPPTMDWIIFAKEHDVDTFVDLLLGEKPCLYLSYHITGQQDFKDVERFRNKLSSSFVCVDPYTIKDWDIVGAYDKALESGDKEISVTVNYRNDSQTFSGIQMEEIEDAINLIRTQIVERDFLLIANVHATVVYHKDEKPSYGVMAEIMHSVGTVNRPVYVLYPFKTRPSPFFEHYVKRENIIHGDKKIESLEDEMVERLKHDCETWITLAST